jgi:hypothetical protein
MKQFWTFLQLKEEYHGRILDGVVGLHEGAEEILAVADLGGVAPIWNTDRSYARIRGCAIHLHVVLTQWEIPSWKGRMG